MDSATVRHDDEGDEEYQEAYWRRRAIALGAVVLVVGGLAWSCSAGGDEKSPAAAKKTEAASPTPTVSDGGTGSASGGPPAIPTVMVTVTKTATVAAPRRPGDACAARDVVATLTPVASRFAPGAQPSFTLTVVNTGKIDCTFDVGAQTLVTRIMSGSDRIWNSAHCDEAGSSIQRLRRGVPHTRVLVWDRRRSDKGCDGSRAKALPGTYVIQAKGGGVRTEKGVFELAEGRRGRG